MPAQPSTVTTDLVQPGPERITGDLGKQIEEKQWLREVCFVLFCFGIEE